MIAGDNRGHGGNSGYDDQIDAYYSWDSKVPNHKRLQPGDLVAFWDKKALLGVSVIEEIETSPGFKEIYRCPNCRRTRIQKRKRSEPTYRCSRCAAEFNEPILDSVPVIRYRARHDAAWTPLDGLLDADELRALNTHRNDINAMRPIDQSAFLEAVSRNGAFRATVRATQRSPDLSWARPPGLQAELSQGFTSALVRVRRGQRKFREQILAINGSRCAFTGAAPERVLEAGHLYSYARLGTHDVHGGLMLRRDIHRLFDDGLLSVDPTRLRVDVADELKQFPQYGRLHDGQLEVPLNDEQIGWLSKHWVEHRHPAPL